MIVSCFAATEISGTFDWLSFPTRASLRWLQLQFYSRWCRSVSHIYFPYPSLGYRMVRRTRCQQDQEVGDLSYSQSRSLTPQCSTLPLCNHHPYYNHHTKKKAAYIMEMRSRLPKKVVDKKRFSNIAYQLFNGSNWRQTSIYKPCPTFCRPILCSMFALPFPD